MAHHDKTVKCNQEKHLAVFRSDDGDYIKNKIGKISVKIDIGQFSLVDTVVIFEFSTELSMDVSYAHSIIKTLANMIVRSLDDGLDGEELIHCVKESLVGFLADEKVEVKKAFLGTGS